LGLGIFENLNKFMMGKGPFKLIGGNWEKKTRTNQNRDRDLAEFLI